VTTDAFEASPFVGLRPFVVEDSLYFHGRDEQTSELLNILRQTRFLGVVGGSGSGKSSLVRAGLLPALLAGFLAHDRDSWRTVQMRPGDAPMANLAAGLIEAMADDPQAGAPAPDVAALAGAIREDHDEAVIEFLGRRLGETANLLLLVDQFEEIFAFRGGEDSDDDTLDPERRRDAARRRAEATEFVDLLLRLSEQRGLPIYVVLTMRTDFLGDCDLFRGLPEALNRSRYLVPRMAREQLRDAVECPVLIEGADASPRLLDQLLNELGDRFDRLPLLQHALQRTWAEWQAAGGLGPLDLRHYEAAGRIEGALDQDAEKAMEGLDAAVVARVFKRLTDTDSSGRRVRSPARVSDLMAVAGADRDKVMAILRAFKGEGRSFVHWSDDGDASDPRVDISHESLIRQWKRLGEWVAEEQRSRDQYLDLAKGARRWKRGEADLLRDPELQIVLDWRETERPTAAWAVRHADRDDGFTIATEYLDASLEQRCVSLAETWLHRRWRILIGVILGIEVVVGVYWLFAGVYLGPVKNNLPDTTVSLNINGANLSNIAAKSISINWDDEISAVLFSWQFPLFVVGVVICIFLNFYIEKWHEQFSMPDLLRRSRTLGGRQILAVVNKQPATEIYITKYAALYRRLGSGILDMVITMMIFLVTSQILDIIHVFSISSVAFVVYFYVVSWLYVVLQITSKRQATFGMRLAGTFRTGEHGERLSLGRATTVYLYSLLSTLVYGIGWWIQPVPLARHRTFHDLMTKTVVLRRRPWDNEWERDDDLRARAIHARYERLHAQHPASFKSVPPLEATA
jgi:uncharacterized RDD family membrane protein YckC